MPHQKVKSMPLEQSTPVESTRRPTKLHKCRRENGGKGKKARQDKFNGLPLGYVIRISDRVEKRPEAWTRLSAQERKAIELYWENRLCVAGESFNRGCNPDWLTYETDIVVLDFFAEDKTYEIPQVTGERLESEE